MRVHIVILTFIFALCLPFGVYAQKDHTKAADNIFEIGEYYRSIDKYKKALSKSRDNVKKNEINFKISMCYRLINDSRSAESWFKKTVKRKYPDPIAVLYFADALKMNEKYDDAIIEYENYKNLVPDDPRGEEGIQSCRTAIEWIANPERYIVENVKVFNSRLSDYSLTYASEDYMEVYFTSAREGADGKKVHGVTGQGFADIFTSKLDRKGKWSEPTPLDEKINSQYDDGASFLIPGASNIYFTRCRFDKSENLGCQILTAQKSGKTWTDPTVIPLTADSLIAAHPSVSLDETKMLFTGNMPEGKGGKDIWMAERESTSATWGKPVNMGNIINTSGDEMFPFFKNDSLIYFSSNGHPGMGGLDIFKAFKSENKWVVENMKVPINSSADDFGIVFQPGKQELGYFTSSRLVGTSRRSDDIYSFVLPLKEFKIHGLVINERTETYIDSADIKLIGSDGTNLEVKTAKDGKYNFELNPDTDYILVAVKDGFLNAKARETTMGFDENKDFAVNLVLSPIENSIVLPNINYEFSKWDLRPESLVELDKLVETLNDNPNIRIELSAHTDMRQGINFDNQELSQKRAQSVVNYLISKDIASDRLEAVGYAARVPKEIDVRIEKEYDFLALGDTLNAAFINNLTNEEQAEIAHQINRRTEFRVISTSYVPKPVIADPADEILEENADKEITNVRDTKSSTDEILKRTIKQEDLKKITTDSTKLKKKGIRDKKVDVKKNTEKGKSEKKIKNNTEVIKQDY